MARDDMLTYMSPLVSFLHVKPPILDLGGSMIIILPDPNHFPQAPLPNHPQMWFPIS